MTDNSSKVGRWAWAIALVVGGGSLFLAWDHFGFGGHSALAGGQGLVAQVAGAPSQWTLADETDPMTDEQVVSAHRQIEADGFLIDTAIACLPSSGAITYTFTTFDADGTTPAEFRERIGGNSQTIIILHDAEFRSDNDAARTLRNGDPRYTNMFEVSDTGFQQLGSAQQLTVKLHLQQGEPLFRIDQTDGIVANVVSPCLAAQAAASAKEAQEPKRGWTPAGMVSNGVGKTVTYRITNEGLTQPDTYGRIGVSRQGQHCVGDTIIVENATKERVRPAYGPYPSDSSTDLGLLGVEGSIGFELEEVGEFVLFNQAHAGPWFHYKVSECRQR